MYYTIYQITNLIDNKIYIGKHITKDINDSYMGSGKLLNLAIEKYGINNFEKRILFCFDTEKEMNAKEKEIVNEEFVKREDTYNLCHGGHGGFSYINSHYWTDKKRKERGNYLSNILKGSITCIEAGRRGSNSEGLRQAHKDGKIPYGNFKGKSHSDSTKEKMSEAKKGKYTGTKNSQYGTMWIHNKVLSQSKKIPKDSPIPKGWERGRKIKTNY